VSSGTIHPDAMKALEHEWVDHGRWRLCVQCGQRQYRAVSPARGSVVSSQWLLAAGD
jgi:hypothetical protein